MEIAGTETEAGCYTFSVAHAHPEPLESAFMLAISLHIGEEREVIVGREPIEVQPQAIGKGARLSAGSSYPRIDEHRNAIVHEIRALARRRVVAFDALRQRPRFLLGGFHIRL